MSAPLVSIVSPVYNGEKYFKNCIRGVLKQTYPNFEYIILDNASTDGTSDIIEEFSKHNDRIRVYRNPSTLKIIDNWNESLKYVSPEAEWVKFAFADDYLFPNCVEEMVRVGDASPNIGLVSAYFIKDKLAANVGLPLEQEVAEGKDMLKKHILRKLHVCLNSPNTVCYKKSVLEEMGGFDNTYFHADTELALRILNHYNLGFVHKFLTWTGVHQETGSAFAQYNGLIIREYLMFAYKNIGRYEGIHLTHDEFKEISEFYADEIARYVSVQLVNLLWRQISTIWAESPPAVKKRMIPVIRRKWPVYARRFLGSIFHYKKRAQNKPTFIK